MSQFELVANRVLRAGRTNESVEERPMGRRVFIVHGHDDALKHSVARFLEKLNLEAVILHEQSNGGKTLIEKLEAHGTPDYVVVLCTPDDRVEGEETFWQPRPNVLLELGYFVGRSARSKVATIVDAKCKLPSDLGGFAYIERANWQSALIGELDLVVDLDPSTITKALTIR